MNIYEIDRNFADTMEEIMLVFDEETGEVTDVDKFEELKRRLNELQEERNTKISNVACWYKQLCAEAEAIKAEKMALAKRQQTAEKKAESLKKYLDYALQGEKFEDARCKISYRASEQVQLDPDLDPFNLPIQFQKVSIEANKTELKKALKNGEKVDGVALVEKKNIQIK